MERRKVSAVCVFLVFVAYGARADGYTDLLSMAWDKDAAQAGLDLDLRAAGLALERFEATAGTWQLSAGADPVSIKAAGDAPFSVEAKANATLSSPGGASVSVESFFPHIGEAGPAFDLGLAIPLLGSGGRDRTIRRETLLADILRAENAMARRRLEVELRLIAALKAYATAERASKAAFRAEAEASRDLDRAIRVDGARPGGAAYLALRRKEHAARRDRSAAEKNLRSAALALCDLCSCDAEYIGRTSPGSLLPPESSGYGAIPAASDFPSVLEARRRLEWACARTVDGDWKLSLDARLSLPAGVGAAGGDASGARGFAGLGFKAGGFQGRAGVSWYDPPGVVASAGLSWSSLASAEAACGRQEAALEIQRLRLALDAAIEDSELRLRAFEDERAALDEAEAELGASAAFADEQRALYDAWIGKGVVTETELAELAASIAELDAERLIVALDRRAWELRLRMAMYGSGD